MKRSVTIKAAWIGVGGAILAAIVYGVFSLFNSKPTAINGDNVGRDKVTYVAGDQIIKQGPSPEELAVAVRKALQDHDESLRMKYGEKYTIAAIVPNHFVVPKGDIPSGVKVKWETGRVIHMSSESVQIEMPEIIINTDQNKNGYIAGNIINLPKKVGAKVNLIKMQNFSIVIEVIGIDRDIVIVGLGMAPGK